LCKEIKEIVNEIILNAAQVRSLGKKIVIIIFTDVIPTDGNLLLDYLAPVNTLPVTLVVRLCTGKKRE
jgi:hypothetical protein